MQDIDVSGASGRFQYGATQRFGQKIISAPILADCRLKNVENLEKPFTLGTLQNEDVKLYFLNGIFSRSKFNVKLLTGKKFYNITWEDRIYKVNFLI